MKRINRTTSIAGRRHRPLLQDLSGLAVSLFVTSLVSFLASQFEPGEWYNQLSKPGWTPPNWIFPLVWTVLYASMSVAVWLVWRQGRSKAATVPVTAYFFQLLLNGIWSWLFFGNRLIGLALIDILGLFVAVIVTTILFWKRTRLAGILFVPYLLWVGFAAILNYGIWLLN